MQKVKQPKQIDPKTLTAAERRVLIAKDVIAALNTKRMRARTNSGSFERNPYVDVKLTATTLQEDARKALAKPCIVCAKGAALIACVDRFNKVKLQDLTLTSYVENFGYYDNMYIDYNIDGEEPKPNIEKL